MGDWWQREIIDPGKLPLLVLFSAFVVTFLGTRAVTRLIRAGRGPFRNVSHGGVHVHHSVPGVILLVVGAFIAVATTGTPLATAAAVLVGVGTSLVLDEFAMILHLDDVYWSNEGRTSVEVVALAAACLGLMLVGATPTSAAGLGGAEDIPRMTLLSALVLHYGLVVIAVLKGKYRFALIGCFVGVFAWVAAARLARPGSWWSRHYGPRRQQKARPRAERFDARWDPFFLRWSDRIAGRPSRPDPES